MRLSDVDALRDNLYAQFRTAEQIPGLEIDERLIMLTIDNAPTIDAVPVVRCAECIHSREIEKVPANRYFTDRVKHCTELRGSASDDGISAVWRDGYCDDGQRKEEST